jgi:hypothetical protein
MGKAFETSPTIKKNTNSKDNIYNIEESFKKNSKRSVQLKTYYF